MGTPEFAVPVFQAVIDLGYDVVGLVSQPDRPVGRKKEILPTPTKKLALENEIPVFQPEHIKDDYETIKTWNPDLIITCAYGQIIPQGLLDLPRFGCINVHASLLPKLRGGAPIHRAIMNDDFETGITIIDMVAKMDAGKMYTQSTLPIVDNDNLESLSDKLSDLGALILSRFLPDYLAGTVEGIEQDEAEVTFGYNIKPEEERIDWNLPSRTVFNHIRALDPQPGAYTTLNGQHLKVYRTQIETHKGNEPAGTILDIKDGILVKTSDGALKLEEVQLEGKRRMTAQELVNGLGKSLLKEQLI
jgi:methionyl-tRNA formyltransferase